MVAVAQVAAPAEIVYVHETGHQYLLRGPCQAGKALGTDRNQGGGEVEDVLG